MEVLQCDGCDFRAQSYEELKSHIQDVHTAFLQPTDVTEESSSQARTVGTNSTNQSEAVFSSLKNEFVPTEETHGQNTPQAPTGSYYSPTSSFYDMSSAASSKPTNKFFQCKFCVRYFRSKYLLVEHTRKVHGHASGNTGASGNYNIMLHDGFGKVFSCQFCTYKSPRRARIIKHQKMYHKNSLKESLSPSVSHSTPTSMSIQETCKELPAEVVERSILESMVKPLTKSRGNFCCEWCSYQTPRRERWCDHMMKKHRGMVKILSSLRQDGLNMPDFQTKGLQMSSPGTSYMPLNMATQDLSSANISGYRTPISNLPGGNTSKYQSMSYVPMKPKFPSNAGILNVSERSPYVISEKSTSMVDMDENSLLNDSSSDEDYIEIDGENGFNLMDHHDMSGEPLLGSENNKLLETKGIPFRRFMNRFQCPFCPFLTMHRRSISRHIENIHLSGKTAVYKCDECPFSCKSPLKLGAHKQCHSGASPDWDPISALSESMSSQLNEVYDTSNINGRKSGNMPETSLQNPYKCTMCNYSTTTLKGLRVHQQHKHSFCDNMPNNSNVVQQIQENEQDSSNSGTVRKSQTSILGLSSKNNFVAKASRKISNDFPLDLSPVKKRTRIDEIASNLQSKISQTKQQEDTVINVEDDEDEEENEVEIEVELDKEEDTTEQLETADQYSIQQIWNRDIGLAQKNMSFRNIQHSYSAANGAEIELTLSDDDEEYYFQSIGFKDQDQNSSVGCNQSNQFSESEQNSENAEYNDESGRLYYCKHCDFSNKSARSVSTHYQRMHPYIKFSFRYILDPNDHSAVYRCLECYIDYNNFEDLQQHYGEHHPEAMNVLNFDQSDLIYRCRFCSYTSPNVRSLMPHYQRMHPTVKINNAMIFSSYVVERQEELNAESQTLREILNSAPKNMVTSTPSGHGISSSATFNKPTQQASTTKPFSTENETQKNTAVNNVVVYDCDVCGFASPNMHSVLVHYQKKHPDEKASYFRIQKTMRIVTVDSGTAISQLAFDGGSSVTPNSTNVAAAPEENVELYYCKHCSYSNRSVVGVLVHYQKRHPEIKVTAKYIRQAPPNSETMRNADPQQYVPGKQSTTMFNTKKGSVQPKENEMFFCQHCDYGNQTVKGVLIHYQKKHRDYKVNADVIRQHTAAVRSLCEQGQKKSSTNIQTSPPNNEPEKTKLRTLKCRQCLFSTPYVYSLRKHMKKDHPSLKATVTLILKWAFLDGLIEAGYHCEWCIYSHPEPSGLLEHYQRRHPEHYVDYTYMATKLCAGPDPVPVQSTPELKSYKCRDCTFEASSIWDITNHYQAVHPWVLKGDESVLLDIIKEKDAAQNVNCEEETSETYVTQKGSIHFETHMESLENTSVLQEKPTQLSSALASSPYQCTVCLSEYNNLHGLLTHYGKKHPGMKVKAADFAQDVDINPGAVYKCRHCPYINTRIHGVLTHYQKRHPLIKVTAEDFVHDVEPPNESVQNDNEENNRIFKQGYGAYRCKICPYTHGTLEKLKIHYEKYHNQPEADMISETSPNEISSTEPDTPADDQPHETVVTLEPGEVTEILDFRPRKNTASHTVFKCQLCKYFCSTRKGIARHYRIKHNNVRAQPEGKNNLFKCALCSYTNPIRKGLAAHYQKRHDIDAYYTHCLAASRTVNDKPSKMVLPLPQKESSTELNDDLKKAIERKTCSLCSFQSYSKKGIVSHYVKRHPGVFPKKAHGGKLDHFFTPVYSEKHKDQSAPEDMSETEAPFDDSESNETELLPYRCIKCFKLSFSTADLLCMHYTDHHSKDVKRDFSILGTTGTRSYTTTYQCKHCNSKLNSIAELTSHLTSHIEEFQKRAKRQERRKQLLSKQKNCDIVAADGKQEKTGSGQEGLKENIVGYKCKFCVEIHPTLRAICNHLRKHVQYGNAPPLPPELKEDTTQDDGKDLQGQPVDSSTQAGECSTEVEQKPMPTPLPKRCRPGGYPCKQCDRVLMSMQGLRSHERSHLALALFAREGKYNCKFCSFVSAFRPNLHRHIQDHHGHNKPFRCKHCPFKSSYKGRLKTHILKAHGGEHGYKCSFCPVTTITISQLKDHSIQVHGKALTLPKVRSLLPNGPRAKQSSRIGKESRLLESSYFEPPDVQQQLNHYQSAAQSRNNSNNSPTPLPVTNAVPELKEEAVLNCEFCDFSSGYIQSIRRHYRDKHGGKKLFKCKECSFYTCYKSAFTMHVEAGHSTCPEEGPKDLRCPLCLYHTKYKHNMIDHIVLHREERVVPIEVCRSKLSKQLQGVVFRCDKCTFTCSSDDSLQQHIEKHNELKPYKCQLCYYQAKLNEELDSHLREEHKVCRNFELVGLVNLDQLEQMKDKTETSSSDEEECATKNGGLLVETRKAWKSDQPSKIWRTPIAT
ncbi:zinc finger protein 462 isoform X3 [Phyllobates terribilis]|uniref:zinc finger protein 462 isoform X3 n=1 Tax=Phyllobates terribilis TaxID=111132 RepID=UPI003CCB56B0